MILLPVVSTAALAALIGAVLVSPAPVRRVDHSEPIDETPAHFSRFRRPRPIRRRAMSIGPAALASWADDLARSLRHGSTLHSALTTLIPDDEAVRQASAPLRHWLDRGTTVDDACDDWADDIIELEVGRPELITALAAVIGATAALGGAASTPLQRFAVTMRQHVSDELERGAQSAQAALSARVLTLVPVAVLALLLATDDDVRTVIAGPTGATVIGVGLALNAVGGWWMRRIVGTATTGGGR